MKPLEFEEIVADGDIKAAKAAFAANKGLFETKTVFGTWLHTAAREGQLEMAKLLVSMGADVNAPGGVAGGAPLNEAAQEGRLEMVKYLCVCGAKLDVSEPERNPLFSAIQGYHVDVVKHLIDAGIDTKVKYSGESMKNTDALAFAQEYGNEEIIQLLAKAKGVTAGSKAKNPKK